MEEISVPEEEFGEPALNYWRPVSKPLPLALSPLASNCMGNGYDNLGWSHPVTSYTPPGLPPPPYIYHRATYPLTDVIHSYIQNQQIGLSPGGPSFEGERRRLPQYSIGSDHALYTLSTNPNFEQHSQTMTDNMIQDEVTRAAKTLFSKRNRTLLHWLNPDVNKNQIKIDVNAAWESLPTTEKVFYISQVLGRFSPHVTSLMVNPQLEPSNMECSSIKSACIDKNSDKSNTCEFKSPKVKRKPKPTEAKTKLDTNVQTVKKEIKIEDGEGHDSDLVVDLGKPKVEKPKKVDTTEEKIRVKRKYTKRKHKESSLEGNVVRKCSNCCPLPVDVKDIKVQPDVEIPVDVKDIKMEPDAEIPVDVKNIKVEPDAEIPVDIKDIKMKSKTKVDKKLSNTLPRPKRKYVKRKLVRKKYKRREPKQKPPINEDSLEKIKEEEHIPESLQTNTEEMEMDLWIEIGGDSILTNEEVDSFFESIGDPSSLFCELGILEN